MESPKLKSMLTLNTFIILTTDFHINNAFIDMCFIRNKQMIINTGSMFT